MGEGQLKDQAKYQWDRLDAEGRKIIKKILIATPLNVEWPIGMPSDDIISKQCAGIHTQLLINTACNCFWQ